MRGLLLVLASLVASTAALGQRRLRYLAAMAALSHVPLVAASLAEDVARGLATAASLAALAAASLYASSRVAKRAGTDDIESLGGLYASMPYTTWSFVGAAVGLAMFPPFPHFHSLHELAVATAGGAAAPLLLAVGRTLLLAALFYAVRRAFFGEPRVEASEGPVDYAPPSLLVALSLAASALVWRWG